MTNHSFSLTSAVLDDAKQLLFVGSIGASKQQLDAYLDTHAVAPEEIREMMAVQQAEHPADWLERSIAEVSEIFNGDIEAAQGLVLIHCIEHTAESLGNKLCRTRDMLSDRGYQDGISYLDLQEKIAEQRHYLIQLVAMLSGTGEFVAALPVDSFLGNLRQHLGLDDPIELE